MSDASSFEKALSSLYEVVERNIDGILVVTGGSAIKYANRALRNMLGNPVEISIAQHFSNLSISESPREITLFTDLKKTRDAEIRSLEVEWLNEKAVLYFVRDISDRKEVERARLDAEESRLANKLKSEFLANMSHEIRTPLNAIVGSIDVLRREELSEKQKLFIQIMQNSSKSLLALINDILDLSKIEAGQVSVEPSNIEVEELSKSLIGLFLSKAREKNIKLSVDIRKDVPDSFMVDGGRLKQILTNLLSNAVKFTEVGMVEFEVSRRDDKILFTVKDTGIGIPEKDFKLIFDAFRQVDPSISKNYGGTGLGLHIVKNLVELMGGQVWVKSKLGAGSTFFIELPLKGAHSSNQMMKVQGKVPHPKNGKFSSLNVLVAEDETYSQILLKEFLFEEFNSIEMVGDGKLALEKYKSGTYDVILMDMQMPVMDGYESTRCIRQYEAERGLAPVKIIAFSAWTLTDDIRSALEAGCDMHVSKPLNKEILVGAIRKIVTS